MPLSDATQGSTTQCTCSNYVRNQQSCIVGFAVHRHDCVDVACWQWQQRRFLTTIRSPRHQRRWGQQAVMSHVEQAHAVLELDIHRCLCAPVVHALHARARAEQMQHSQEHLLLAHHRCKMKKQKIIEQTLWKLKKTTNNTGFFATHCSDSWLVLRNRSGSNRTFPERGCMLAIEQHAHALRATLCRWKIQHRRSSWRRFWVTRLANRLPEDDMNRHHP